MEESGLSEVVDVVSADVGDVEEDIDSNGDGVALADQIDEVDLLDLVSNGKGVEIFDGSLEVREDSNGGDSSRDI